jgi:hypothetical protein
LESIESYLFTEVIDVTKSKEVIMLTTIAHMKQTSASGCGVIFLFKEHYHSVFSSKIPYKGILLSIQDVA